MSASRAFLSLLALVALAPGSRAAQGDFFAESSTEHIVWPADLPALQKGRMVVGDVTGDLLPDAILLNGTKPVIVYGPAIYRSVFEVDIEANDVAVVPATEEERARLIVVNSAGAWVLSDYDAGSFDAFLLPAPTWAGAERVLVADVDGDEASDLVGVSAENELLFLQDFATTDRHETAVPLAGTVFDLAPLDWDEAAGQRVALLCSDGFFVMSASGETIESVPGAVSGGIVQPLRQQGFLHERCAVVLSVAEFQAVVVVDSVEPDDENPLPLGTPGVFGAAVSDADGDGNDDLYLVHGTSHETVLLLNTAGSAATTFVPGNGEVVDVAPGLDPAPSWSAWPALADFSLDGDPDLLLFVEASTELVLLENASRSVEAKQVAVTGGSYFLDLGAGEATLGLGIQAPSTLDFDPTHVQVIGWVQPDAASGGLVVDPVAIAHDFFPLNASHKAHASIELPEAELHTSDIYHFDVRAVRVDDPERGPVESGPPSVHAFTTPIALVDDLEAEYGPGIALRTSVVGGGRPRFMREFGVIELFERSLAPKEVKTPKVPVINLPPDPFQ